MSTLRICFRDAAIGAADAPIFRHFSWVVEPFQAWVITGANGSGKSALAQALAGGLPVTSRSPETNQWSERPDADAVALISFERQREIVFDERYHDDGEFMDGGVDPGTAALDFILRRKRGAAMPPITAPARLEQLVRRLGIGPLLGRGVKYLSTGEIRKVLLCRELLREPTLLIFDEPYEGLDAATRVVLREEIERLVAESVQPSGEALGPRPSNVLVITDRYEHVPQATTHVLHIVDRGVAFAGTRKDFEARGIPSELKQLGAAETAVLNETLAATVAGEERAGQGPGRPLIELRNVVVSYGGRRVLSDLSLSIRTGEHTLVRGPNGCGKTTLLNLINGDNPQVYANDVTVCGMKRGSGESIWQVKARLGQVSYALHVEYAYRCYASLIETVLSGFHDSIGLYREPNYSEISAAERWLGVVGLTHKRAEPFSQLSYGEQRVALILRAVVKQPELLILDEPCHGLDARHRSEVLTIADYIGQHTDATLLYVTHDPDEQLACTRQVFEYRAQGWVLTVV